MRMIIIALKYNQESAKALAAQVKALKYKKGPYKPFLGK